MGKFLLKIRTEVNSKIAQLIMRREINVKLETDGSCPECAFLERIKVSLDEVIKGNGKEVTKLTMLLMTIDTQTGNLYNQIISELDESKRTKSSEELRQLKGISVNINSILSQMVDNQDNGKKIKRLVSRDCVKVRSKVER